MSAKRKASSKATAAGKRKPDPKKFHINKRADAILEATANADDKALSPKEAARLIGMSEVWLSKRRLAGDGPPYKRWSPHCIKYPLGELRAWLKQQRSFTSTSQYEHARPGKPLAKKQVESGKPLAKKRVEARVTNRIGA